MAQNWVIPSELGHFGIVDQNLTKIRRKEVIIKMSRGLTCMKKRFLCRVQPKI